jgi:hypothetical protein
MLEIMLEIIPEIGSLSTGPGLSSSSKSKSKS